MQTSPSTVSVVLDVGRKEGRKEGRKVDIMKILSEHRCSRVNMDTDAGRRATLNHCYGMLFLVQSL